MTFSQTLSRQILLTFCLNVRNWCCIRYRKFRVDISTRFQVIEKVRKGVGALYASPVNGGSMHKWRVKIGETHVFKFSSKVECRVNVISKVKADSFRLIGHRDQTKGSCKSKLCRTASELITKVPWKEGANAEVRTTCKDQAGSAYENIARVSCNTCLLGQWSFGM